MHWQRWFLKDQASNLRTIITCTIYSEEAKNGRKITGRKRRLWAEDIENVKKLREIYNGNDHAKHRYLQEAERLEGSVRNTGIHAAGIIIAPKDLTELIPVATAKDSDLWVTQIEGSVIEEAGVIKDGLSWFENIYYS